MAFITQEEKKEIAPVVKGILAEYGLKGTLGINNHSTLVLKIKNAAAMFAPYFRDSFDRKWGIDVNEYWIDRHYADNPTIVEMLTRVADAMKGKNYFNNDDAMTDYFHRKHYIDIKVLGEEGK